MKAFEADFGRIGLDPSFLGNVRDMANDPARASMFGPMGISDDEVAAARRSGDYGQLTVDAIKAAKRFSDQAGPDGRSPQMMRTMGLGEGGLGLDQSHLAVIGAQSNEDLDRYGQQFQTDSRSMNIADPTQKSYQDLSASISRLTGDFEAAFFSGGGMGTKLTKMVDYLDEIVKNKGWTGIFTSNVSNPLPDIPHEYTLPAQMHRAFPWIPDWGVKSGPDAPKDGGSVPGAGGADALADGTARQTPAQYRAFFTKLEDSVGLPHGMLMAIGMQESGLNPHPNDTPGTGGDIDAGMFQMSGQMRNAYGVNDAYNANQVAPAAAMELHKYYEEFGHDVGKTLLAWNQGETGMRQAVQRGGPGDGYLDQESGPHRDYLAQVLNRFMKYMDKPPQQVKVTVDNRAGANVHVSANALAPQ